MIAAVRAARVEPTQVQREESWFTSYAIGP